jgi:hypothetical protein
MSKAIAALLKVEVHSSELCIGLPSTVGPVIMKD